ncbi:MAG: O-antigen ligase family protein [Clostridia bacterium]|jgi:hypothetical protein
MSNKKKSKPTAEKEVKENFLKKIFTSVHDKKKMSYCELMTCGFLYIFLASFALIISNEVYGDITETKLYALIAMFGVWVILMFYGIVEKVRAKTLNSLYFKDSVKNLTVTDIALISYTLVAFLSSILSEYKTTSFLGLEGRNEGFLMQLMYISMFFMLSKFYVNKYELKIFAAASIIVAFIGILQINGYYVGKITYNITEYGTSYLTTLGNIDVVSTYLVTPIMLFTVLYCQSSEKIWRLLYFASAGMCFYFSILIGVDSGYVGMLAGLGIMFPFIAKDRISATRIFQMLAMFLSMIYLEDQISQIGTRNFVLFENPFSSIVFLGILACLAISAVIYFVGKHITVSKKCIWPIAYFLCVCMAGIVLIKKVLGMTTEPTDSSIKIALYQLGQILKGNLVDEYGSNRVYAWRVIYSFFKEKPIIGHGPDTVMDLWMREEYVYSMQKYNTYFDKAHNDYLQVLVTTGILGLVSYLTFQFSLLIRSFKKFNDPLVIALVTASICFCAQAFFNIGVPIVSPYGWILFGMLASVIRNKKDTEK